MNSGQLTEIIEVLEKQVTKNAYGAETTSWESKLSTRAKVLHNSGSRNLESMEVTTNYSKSFKVRYFHIYDISENDRIVYGGKTYEIQDLEPNFEYQELTINCTLVNE